MPATQVRLSWTTLTATTSHCHSSCICVISCFASSLKINLTHPSDSQLYQHSRRSFTLRFSSRQLNFIDLQTRANAGARVSEDSKKEQAMKADFGHSQQSGRPCSCIAIGPAVSQMSACTRSLWKCFWLWKHVVRQSGARQGLLLVVALEIIF